MPSSRRIVLPFIAMVPLAARATPGVVRPGVHEPAPAVPDHRFALGGGVDEVRVQRLGQRVHLPPQLRYREISPGQVVTQEYQPERLNIFLDPKGWIGRVSCG